MASQVRGPGRVRSVEHPNASFIWHDPDNAASDDTTFAATSGLLIGSPEWLWADEFGFSIPSEATITGVTAKIRRFSTTNSGSDYILDEHVALSIGGAITGGNLAKTTLPDDRWPTTVDTAVYGGGNEQWGTTLTPSNVNTSTFGFALIAEHFVNPRSQSPPNACVEFMSMEVFYEEPMEGQSAIDTGIVLDATATAGVVEPQATLSADLVLDTAATAHSPAQGFAWVAPPENAQVEDTVQLVTQATDPRVAAVRYRIGDTIIGIAEPE